MKFVFLLHESHHEILHEVHWLEELISKNLLQFSHLTKKVLMY